MRQIRAQIPKQETGAETLLGGSSEATRRGVVLRTLRLCLLAPFISYGIVYSLPLAESLRDFGSFLMSGRAAREGLDPYGAHAFVLPGFDTQNYGLNLNPPISVLAFRALSDLDPVMMFRAWFGLSMALYVLVLVLLGHAYATRVTFVRIVWALGLAGLWSSLHLGQIYTLLFATGVAAWLLLKRKRLVLAGLLIGILVAIKPNFVVWPVLLLAAGYPVAALPALLSGAVLSAVPLLVFGPSVYSSWLQVLPAATATGAATNGSLIGLMDRLGMPWVGIAAATVLLLAIATWAWRCRPCILFLSAVAITSSLLAAPLAWEGYTLLLLPVFFERSWGPLLTTAAVLLLPPAGLVMDLSRAFPWSLFTLGSAYNAALLLVFIALAMEALRPLASRVGLVPPSTPILRTPP
ncbi:MAG: DUF2029 domain-containing protein [Chloroflexota bacterium]|nr:MAG: DUF2029 domain-containing protein [Chloroflexota bacterium]